MIRSLAAATLVASSIAFSLLFLSEEKLEETRTAKNGTIPARVAPAIVSLKAPEVAASRTTTTCSEVEIEDEPSLGLEPNEGDAVHGGASAAPLEPEPEPEPARSLQRIKVRARFADGRPASFLVATAWCEPVVHADLDERGEGVLEVPAANVLVSVLGTGAMAIDEVALVLPEEIGGELRLPVPEERPVAENAQGTSSVRGFLSWRGPRAFDVAAGEALTLRGPGVFLEGLGVDRPLSLDRLPAGRYELRLSETVLSFELRPGERKELGTIAVLP